MRQAILGKPLRPAVSSTVWFAFRFLFISITLFLLMEIAPDDLFYPLNRINTILAAGVLDFFGLAPSTRGLTIMFEGFRAQVIGECSAVFTSILPVAFMIAFPGSWKRKKAGLLVGLTTIFLVNVARISLLVLVGARAPHLFDAVHLYVGQTAMMLLIVSICFIWVHWAHGQLNLQPVWAGIIRCALLSLAGFTLWHQLGEEYTWLQYRISRSVLAWLGVKAGLPVALRLYPDTFLCFNLITFTVLTGTFTPRVQYCSSWKYWLAGMALIACLHFMFRLLQLLYASSPAHSDLAWGITALLVVNEWLLPFGLFLYSCYRYRATHKVASRRLCTSIFLYTL